MKMSSMVRTCLLLSAILAITLLGACGNPAPADAPPVTQPSTPPATVTPPDDPSGPPDKVEIVYFHSHQRCKTCLCFEERVSYVVKTYFQDELDSGKLTFQVFDLGNEEHADMARKYSAISSQLFINTIKDSVDHIADIQDIWSWDCSDNEEGFDQAIKNIIEQSLEGER